MNERLPVEAVLLISSDPVWTTSPLPNSPVSLPPPHYSFQPGAWLWRWAVILSDISGAPDLVMKVCLTFPTGLLVNIQRSSQLLTVCCGTEITAVTILTRCNTSEVVQYDRSFPVLECWWGSCLRMQLVTDSAPSHFMIGLQVDIRLWTDIDLWACSPSVMLFQLWTHCHWSRSLQAQRSKVTMRHPFSLMSVPEIFQAKDRSSSEQWLRLNIETHIHSETALQIYNKLSLLLMMSSCNIYNKSEQDCK